MAINYNGDIAVVLDMPAPHARQPARVRAGDAPQHQDRQIVRRALQLHGKNRAGADDDPKMEFSYKDGEDFVFTDPENYETVTLAAELVGDAKNYLVENAR
jgi:hypothetical protein